MNAKGDNLKIYQCIPCCNSAQSFLNNSAVSDTHVMNFDQYVMSLMTRGNLRMHVY